MPTTTGNQGFSPATSTGTQTTSPPSPYANARDLQSAVNQNPETVLRYIRALEKAHEQLLETSRNISQVSAGKRKFSTSDCLFGISLLRASSRLDFATSVSFHLSGYLFNPLSMLRRHILLTDAEKPISTIFRSIQRAKLIKFPSSSTELLSSIMASTKHPMDYFWNRSEMAANQKRINEARAARETSMKNFVAMQNTLQRTLNIITERRNEMKTRYRGVEKRYNNNRRALDQSLDRQNHVLRNLLHELNATFQELGNCGKGLESTISANEELARMAKLINKTEDVMAEKLGGMVTYGEVSKLCHALGGYIMETLGKEKAVTGILVPLPAIFFGPAVFLGQAKESDFRYRGANDAAELPIVAFERVAYSKSLSAWEHWKLQGIGNDSRVFD
ncbi:hypothetical protein G7Y89_g8149 [Cudoniella acicularis]|uniref:Uncharacterized protein n=1 Tax=Cudoniella acicularis TaxID=354080 RepID=A0A8H4RI01_9HELO|nr:hypothetical protein G7Y89_g8149 [Cudoniella acicularis]